ncbi:MAG: ATP-binding cassette domain-containing protein [Spirochaetales bacterium]|nr:ATP-binding cassette domain-containing protein [Spirochaetales bacterium]
MAFISLQDIFVSYGEFPLLDHINLQIEQNQRICLLGRNGTGKSTLMKVIAGVLQPDSGRIISDRKISTVYFEQEIPQKKESLVFDVIAGGFPDHEHELMQYFRDEEHIDSGKKEAADDVKTVHTPENWTHIQQIIRIAQDLGIECKAEYESLSGGQKRRALLAAALVCKPDLLLLDEPTNHLDIKTITWLEEYILKFCPTVLFVTHDRAFLKRLATRIIELDRGLLFDYHCPYDIFLERKKAFLENQEKEWANFDKKLSEEEAWLRKGIRARRTRNEGRVKALLKMREERQARQSVQGKARLEIGRENKSGKIVIEAGEISFSYTETPVIHNFSTLITRGDKIGIVGPNGCGKTTLINLLLGKLTADTGSIKQGANLSVAFFDQMRSQIDPDKSVHENVLPNGDTVFINGKSKHILAYLQDFLFSPQRSRSPVSQLSGGERNRLLLAKLFTQPCNLLVMDEPTNDLDAETLELLEDLIVEFEGTALLISHDRMFLNNATTSLFVFQEDGYIAEITGGYDDWLLYEQNKKASAEVVKTTGKQKQPSCQNVKKPKRKLTFYEQKELEAFPDKIDSLETEIASLHEYMADPACFTVPEKIKTAKLKLSELEKELAASYKRWEDLEAEAASYG